MLWDEFNDTLFELDWTPDMSISAMEWFVSDDSDVVLCLDALWSLVAGESLPAQPLGDDLKR